MTLLYSDILFYGAVLFGIVLIFVIRDSRIRTKLLTAILGTRAGNPAFVRLSRPRRVLRVVLLFAALILAAFAAARPAWGTETIQIAGRGRDVLALFDVSKSMLASDVAPSRLEHAKFFLSQLVKDAKDDRFALISFAGNAFLECPFTADKVSFLQYVEELSCDSIPVGGTNLEKALAAAEEAFRAAETPNKAIVLLTDGEELSGSAGNTFAALQSLGIPLFVVGIGDSAVPSLIPLPNRQFLRDCKGELVRTKLNEPLLKEIAARSGGLYFNSTSADSRLSEVAKAIESREKGLWDQGGSARMVEHPEWFLALAALCLVLALLLPERAKATLALLFFCFAGAVLFGAETSPEKQANPVILYNAAREKQLSSDPAFAAGYETVLKSSQDSDLTARALHNLAAGRHQEAERALQKAQGEVQSQQLDSALKTLEQALGACDGAKELYRQSLAKKSGISAQTAGGNLQRLANDRTAIEELKKKIEELKKQQQQSQQQTQRAKEENQQNQQNQKEQNGKQKPNEESAQKPQSGKSELGKARQTVKDLQKKAEDLQQKQQSEQAKQAQDELEKAQKAQQKRDNASAEKHLDEALKKLGGSAQAQPRQEEKQPSPQQKQQEAPAAPAPQKNGEKGNTAQLVELLTGDEKELRDALKGQMLQNSRIREVEKDW